MARSLSEIFFVDPRVEALLGKSSTELADMGLREFFELAWSKGVEFQVRQDGLAPGLTISMSNEAVKEA